MMFKSYFIYTAINYVVKPQVYFLIEIGISCLLSDDNFYFHSLPSVELSLLIICSGHKLSW